MKFKKLWSQDLAKMSTRWQFTAGASSRATVRHSSLLQTVLWVAPAVGSHHPRTVEITNGRASPEETPYQWGASCGVWAINSPSLGFPQVFSQTLSSERDAVINSHFIDKETEAHRRKELSQELSSGKWCWRQNWKAGLWLPGLSWEHL